MDMDHRQQHVVAFYARHPISAAHILKKLESARGNLANLRPEELWDHDQDHYGGLAVNDVLADRAGLRAGMKIADFCAGLGGPARYFAHRYGVDVTGVELTGERVRGAAVLTQAVGLEDSVRVVEGDVTAAPIGNGVMDAVVSQEALLHVPDKAKALAEAARILKRGGRLCFTDWIVHRPLEDDEAAAMWTGIAAQTLQSIAGYRELLANAGLRVLQVDDLTTDWGVILDERRRMYTRLREDAIKAGTPAGDESFYQAYMKLVDLVQSRALGGARFTAEKP
jgi:sarcosine/dimethylglycine N-methyltransferase